MAQMNHTSVPAARLADVVAKLTELAQELREGKDYPITRLTMLKSLCQDSKIAAQFGLHLTRLARKKAAKRYRLLIDHAISVLEQRPKRMSAAVSDRLFDVLRKLEASQNEYRHVHWADVRIIHSREALIAEYAIRCITQPSESAYWGYMLARHHAERYDPRYGTGLIPASAPAVEDILAFWIKQLRDKNPSAKPSRRQEPAARKVRPIRIRKSRDRA